MRKGVTSLSKSEAFWWMKLRAKAEREAWAELVRMFPRLADFPGGPAGRTYDLKFQTKAEVLKNGR